MWLPLGLLTIAVFAFLASPSTFVLGRGSFWDGVDQWFVGWVADIRRPWLTDVAVGLDLLTNEWLLRLLRWGAVIGLLLFKRWRHLFAFVGLILVVQPAILALSNRMARPRPDGIEILAPWAEFSSPSVPVAALTITLIGMAYAFVIRGRIRRVTLLVAALVVVLAGSARIYLAVDRVTDTLSGGVLAVAATLVVFRYWVPDAVFPVSYSRRKVAHLELTDLRRAAIVNALRAQLGLHAVNVELFGLEASAASSPLLITLDDGSHVFAKLYAQNHLRSDRWYKLGRSLLYGTLEDERPFRTVRALAEHEDYIMRLMDAAGVPGPEPYGIVEITPGREYLLVNEFLDGASEISQAPVAPNTIDRGLRAIRAMWDAGLAHRDIKPGNVLVRDGQIYLIDAAFGETRPSPWRQAVDLANMMMTLSLRSSPSDVYETARRYFTDDDIAEAFAATRGVTIPSELSRALKADPRAVYGQLRRLAPGRPPIRIQRWTRRRIALLITVVVISVLAAWLTFVNLSFVGQLL